MKKFLGLFFLLLASVFVHANPAITNEGKQDIDKEFDTANTLYQEKKYEQAAEIYRSLLS